MLVLNSEGQLARLKQSKRALMFQINTPKVEPEVKASTKLQKKPVVDKKIVKDTKAAPVEDDWNWNDDDESQDQRDH